KDDIEKIITTFDNFEDVETYASVIELEIIKENDCNLNISRYVDTTEEEEPVDIQKVIDEIKELEEAEAITKDKLNGYLKELGFNVL
ncbi:N-6 DNA methylase, partial [Clostridium perfringens]|uniref:N-6 DNA methylase n=1 Tax=Clostridium perfringens TaxID=1502 RepID=UPI0018E43F23